MLLTKIDQLQKQLDVFNIYGSNASGQFVCRACGESISFHDSMTFKKHFTEMHDLRDISKEAK